MVMADPSLLRELVERCESLRRSLARGGGSIETARKLEDATTGTRQLDAALFVARRQLADSLARRQPLHQSEPSGRNR